MLKENYLQKKKYFSSSKNQLKSTSKIHFVCLFIYFIFFILLLQTVTYIKLDIYLTECALHILEYTIIKSKYFTLFRQLFILKQNIHVYHTGLSSNSNLIIKLPDIKISRQYLTAYIELLH